MEIASDAVGVSKSIPAGSHLHEGAIDVGQARPGTLPRTTAAAAREIVKHHDVAFASRREVRMAGFHGVRPVAAVDAVQNRLAQAGACGDDRNASLRNRTSRLKDTDFGVEERRQSVSQCFEIVQQLDPLQTKCPRDARIDVPRDVGQVGDVSGDGPGDASTPRQSTHAARFAVEKRRDRVGDGKSSANVRTTNARGRMMSVQTPETR